MNTVPQREVSMGWRIWIAVSVLGALVGCSSVTVLRTKEMKAVGDDVKKDIGARLQSQMDSLRRELDSLRAVNEHLQRRIIADLGVLSNRLGSDMDRIDARLEEVLYRVDQVVDATRTTLKRVVLDKRKEAQTNAPAVSDGASPSQPVETISGDASLPGGTSGAAADAELETLYATARADFHRGEYKLAFDEFKQVYEKASQAELKENALYWMALCLFETNQQEKGLKVLQRIVDQFPQGKKVCVSLFRMAQISEQSGKVNDQVQILQRLTAQPQCRETNEAYRAIEQLNQLLGADGKIKTQPALNTPPPALP